jgi:hypothetical protein
MNVSIAGGEAASEALTALLNSGSLVFFTGSLPATPETAATGTALVTFAFTSSAFSTTHVTTPSPAVVATANFTAASVNPTASGTAGFARGFESGGTVAVADFTVGVSGSGADITLGSTSIATGVPVDLSSLTITLPSVL